MKGRHFLFATTLLAALAITTYLWWDRSDSPDETPNEPFAPYADEASDSAELPDSGLAVPTATEMERARSRRERRTTEKIERSREIAREREAAGEAEPDDTLNRMGPTGAEALERKPQPTQDNRAPIGTTHE